MSRAYYFGNMYLSSIQQGIQALHCTSEMYLKVRAQREANPQAVVDLYTWGADDKTVVLLNGGDCAALSAIADQLASLDNDYVWAEWSEGKTDLNSALTCVGIILPPRIYESAKELRRPPRYREDHMICKDLTKWELEFIEILNRCRLAS
jgi:hypothetical protein